jgi:queuine/archaeosine tRNA-ribosyltransferase
LVKSRTSEILDVLECINKVRKSDTKIHVFGVARLEAIKKFLEFGVSSVDSSSALRQAWLSSANNYYAPDTDNYAAIRVPIAGKGRFSKKAIQEGLITKEDLLDLEKDCLMAIRQYDQGEISAKKAHKIFVEYGKLMGGSDELYQKYYRTLVERPWDKCPCKVCKDTGIDVVVFRRNNRNRRRGFHNTWVFFNQFKKMTSAKHVMRN